MEDIKISRNNYLFILLIILFPLPFHFLMKINPAHGLIWVLFHHLYYQPVAGLLDEPFFTRDTDIGFFVNLPGRIITPIIYLILFFVYKFVRYRLK